MGAQATTVLSLGREGAPTTFFTSTLTSLVAGFAARQPGGVDGWAVARLACLFAGACGAVLVRRVLPDVALFLPPCWWRRRSWWSRRGGGNEGAARGRTAAGSGQECGIPPTFRRPAATLGLDLDRFRSLSLS
ncbi:DUF1275 family protein [Actinomadura keratinilytica]